MQKRKDKNPISMNKRLLCVVLLCWIIPVISIVTFMTISYRRGIIAKTEGLLADELHGQMEFIAMRMDSAITRTKETSYEMVCEKTWKDYKVGALNEAGAYHIIDRNLKSKFYLDKRFDTSAFYLEGKQEPFCYTSRKGMSFNQYMEEVDRTIQTYRRANSSDAYVLMMDGNIFLIRNLYTTTEYEKFGTLVVEVNQSYLFQDMEDSLNNQILFHVNDTKDWMNIGESKASNKSKEAIKETYKGIKEETLFTFDVQSYHGLMEKKSYDDYTLGMAFLVKRSVLYAELYDLYKIIAIVMMIMIPVLLYMLYFVKRHITVPIGILTHASKDMEEGQFGMVIDKDMPNVEFTYLMGAFNQMSKRVKYLFDYAYDEKIARKDAKIMALQAQINPHFLNNTLEMMNWQARMSGDITVCKMIEALGTVLDYRMNRDHRSLINLAEELRCADAYFYIISMRFGKRLSIQKEIDESILQLQVPQLILQPIIENAVVHGIEQVKSGVVKIHIYHDDTCVYLEVINTGKPMTEEDVERIQSILHGEQSQITKGVGHHTSLGIRNVHERIRLIYGEEYGLTISPLEGDKTCSVITLPYQEVSEESRAVEKEKVQNELKNMGKKNES
ncbi:MAG: histidine kinase [Lachnospiraceae bacterium]